MDSRIIYYQRLPKPILDQVLKRIRQGDPRCSIPVGVRVEKINSVAGDKHKDYDQGVVMGSDYYDNTEFYFVIFDDQLEGKTWTPDFIMSAESEGEEENFFPVLIRKQRIRRLI